MMMYDFDTVIPRKRTGCFKYDALQMMYGDDTLLPLWVADMDFAIAPEVQEAIAKRNEHPIYGYNFRGKAFSEAVCYWQERRFGWKTNPDWQIAHLGVMPALAMAILALTESGDKIVIQPPVYPPFKATVTDLQRQPVSSALVLENGQYRIDFDDLDKKLSKAKMFVLCNPHNPVGRVFTTDELIKIGELCRKHEVIVFNDEIHADIVYKPYQHVSFGALEDFGKFTITAISPAKSFNLAGLATAVLIVENPLLHKALQQMNFALHTYMGNSVGIVAMIAAYTQGEAWLDQLINYLQGNRDLLVNNLAGTLPWLKISPCEGTYLAWLDFSAWGYSDEDLANTITKQAALALNAGITFGQEGSGFMRLNFACPRTILDQAIDRMLKVFQATNGLLCQAPA